MNFPINQAPKYSFKNRTDVEQSSKVGCYWCLNVLESKEIIEYTDADKNGVGQTAICPKCGSDSILSMSYVTSDDLKKIHEHFKLH